MILSDNLYNIISQTLETKQAPSRGVIIDIVEYPGEGYAYRLYRDNLADFSDGQQADIFEYIVERAESAERISGRRVVVEVLEEAEHG